MQAISTAGNLLKFDPDHGILYLEYLYLFIFFFHSIYT